MCRGILFIILFFSSNLFSQNLSFIKERIKMTIQSDSSFTITGKYYFLNKKDEKVSTSFYYPFVINSNYKYPDSILILDENDLPVSYSKGKNGIFFAIKTASKDTSEFTAIYRQRCIHKKAEYILTTTQHWNVPLQNAEYIVNLPNYLNLKFISLQPDSVKNNFSYKTFFITKVNFMPIVNLIVEWGKE